MNLKESLVLLPSLKLRIQTWKTTGNYLSSLVISLVWQQNEDMKFAVIKNIGYALVWKLSKGGFIVIRTPHEIYSLNTSYVYNKFDYV